VIASCTCGEELHRIAISDREWGWVDSKGAYSHRRYPFNPYQRLNELASTDKKDHQYGRRIEEYSRLLVDLEFGGMFHMHKPVSYPPELRADQPDHCGWPAYLAPHGWECRVCQLRLDTVQVQEVD
jgi:hypothetical protein